LEPGIDEVISLINQGVMSLNYHFLEIQAKSGIFEVRNQLKHLLLIVEPTNMQPTTSRKLMHIHATVLLYSISKVQNIFHEKCT